MNCPDCNQHMRQTDLEGSVCRVVKNLGVVCVIQCPHCSAVNHFRQYTAYAPIGAFRRGTDRLTGSLRLDI